MPRCRQSEWNEEPCAAMGSRFLTAFGMTASVAALASNLFDQNKNNPLARPSPRSGVGVGGGCLLPAFMNDDQGSARPGPSRGQLKKWSPASCSLFPFRSSHQRPPLYCGSPGP